MILKKEQIANAKIQCYVSNKIKKATVKIGAKSFEVDLTNAKEIPVLCEFDEFSNYLLKINRMLTDLKLNNEDIKNSDITIVVDNENFVKFMKPEGILLEKTSKSLKKSIDNIEFKRTLGIALYELSTFKKIDLVFKDFLLEEDYNMNNNSNNDFKYTEEDTNFDLNMDISSLSDIINVSELDYSEDDLFKEFDLDTNGLFNDNSSDDFVFQTEEITTDEVFELQDDNKFSDDFIITSQNDFKEETKTDENNFNFDFSLNDEKDALSNDDFSFDENEPLFSKDYLKIEDDFIFEKSDVEKLSDSIYRIEEKVEEPSATEKSVILEDETTEEFIILKDNENTFNFEDYKEEEFNETNFEDITIKEDDIKPEVINKENAKMKEEFEVNKIEEKNNSFGTISNCKENDRDFIEKELIDLKNILERKVDSYKDKIVEFNSKYEEKHLALKDLTLRDEARQLEIFKEFLDCKSTIISLNGLNDTCNSIISDIENKISEIKK